MSRELTPFLDLGFHGDRYLIELVFAAARRSTQFIETGTNVGSSLHYFAKNFPQIRCYSCEPDEGSARFAREKTKPLANARVYHEFSPAFLHTLAKEDPAILGRKETIFWLDSHGFGFQWPLKDEVEFITSRFPGGFLFIDDFKVPGRPQFLFDEYNGQICGFEMIASSLARGRRYRLFYPCYQEKTSPHHPLKGWILIEFGQERPLELPEGLKGKVTIGTHDA